MIIIDSKKQKIRQLHINEAGGKIKGFLLGLTHVFWSFTPRGMLAIRILSLQWRIQTFR